MRPWLKWLWVPIGFALVAWRKPDSIVVIGDSIAGGVGHALGFRTVAKTGSATSYWQKDGRWRDAIGDSKTVVASLGTNDWNANSNPGERVRQLNVEARQLGARVVWLIPDTTLWRGHSLDGVEILKLKCSVANDGVHLTVAGYECAAKAIKSYLNWSGP